MKSPYFILIFSLAIISMILISSLEIPTNFFLSETYQPYFFGSASVWLLYCMIEFFFGLSKSKTIASKMSRALMYFVPAFELSIIAYLAGKDVESSLFRFMIGAGVTFIFGSIALKFEDHLNHETLAQIENNPNEISFDFMKKNGDTFEVIKGAHRGAVYIQCKARVPVTVILLVENKAGKPHYPFPTMKADSNEDLLYLKEQPFSFVPDTNGKPFKLWIVGSADKEQLMNFISATTLNWPSAPLSSFKTLEMNPECSVQ